jgi:hypothetical protein
MDHSILTESHGKLAQNNNFQPTVTPPSKPSIPISVPKIYAMQHLIPPQTARRDVRGGHLSEPGCHKLRTSSPSLLPLCTLLLLCLWLFLTGNPPLYTKAQRRQPTSCIAAERIPAPPFPFSRMPTTPSGNPPLHIKIMTDLLYI